MNNKRVDCCQQHAIAKANEAPARVLQIDFPIRDSHLGLGLCPLSAMGAFGFWSPIVVGVPFVAVFIGIFIRGVHYLDLNKRVYNQVPGDCSTVSSFQDGIFDAELTFQKLILLSTGHKIQNASYEPAAMFLYNASSKQAWKLNVGKKRFKALDAWNPEGISLIKTTLMAVNRVENGTSIEIFTLNEEKKSMKHKKTVKDPLIYNVGDVAAIGPKTFYFTASYFCEHPTFKKIEWFLNTRNGFVGFYDGKTVKKVMEGISSPTGVLFDRSRKLLFVSSFTDQAILIYNADENGKVSFKKRIDLFVSPMLFSFDENFDLILATQPLKFKYYYYETTPFGFFAPSTVLKIRYKKGKTRVTQFYSNDGATISGVAIALKTNEELLLANSNSMVLSCKIAPPQK
ncbi:hypothetical protein L596_028167 [Steinernema carpocapsae]|uniref:Strictosidine synthase conserved region domain-containing protein n=1 Tax=Steinernema carpocapsae TaxID=34508 RepID=A0A4U5LXL9_STECR|nr:hypothetical protein L596_028167 [Steinernema carpocapsae]